MKATLAKLTATATLVALFAPIGARSEAAMMDTVSINLKQFDPAVNDPIEPYGVAPASNWLNLTQSASATNIVGDSGDPTTVDLSGDLTGLGYVTHFGSINNTPMRSLPVVFGASMSLTLSDLSSTFSSYDIITYVSGFNVAAGGNIGSVSDGTDTFVYTVPNPLTSALIQSTDTNPGDGADVATYVRFDGLTADSVTITLTSLNGGVGIAGLQVVGELVPEPSSVLLLLASVGVVGYLRR